MFQADEYDKVELPGLEQLQGLGWTFVPGLELSPETSSERSSYRDVVLENHFKSSIKRINPWISDENLGKVVRDLRLHGL